MSHKQTAFPTTAEAYNKALDNYLHRIKYMNIKRWKILKSSILSISVLLFAGYAIMQGAEPTTVAIPALIMAGLIAGVEWSEFLAVWAEASTRVKEKDND